MKKLNELFEVTYGNKLDMNKMKPLPIARGGVAFVGRSSQNNGVTGAVAPIKGCPAYPAGLITVALGGSKLLASFVQERPFYTAQNVAVLRPLAPMTFAEKVFVCICIRHNRFRYSAFGREANRTLRELPIPDRADFPDWLADPAVQPGRVAADLATDFEQLPLGGDPEGEIQGGGEAVSDLFVVSYGHSYELCNLALDPNGVNFVSRRTGNNGVSARVARTADPPSPAGSISVALGGTVLESYVQPEPYYSGRDIAILTAKRPMSLAEKVFYALAIKWNRFRYNYGRQANRTLPSLRMPPLPDWFASVRVEAVQRDIAREVRGAFPATTLF